MNRAERRRQAKRKRSAPPSPSPLPPVATLKASLQRLSSPVKIAQYLDSLIARGLPPAAAEELRVYAAEFHDATAILQSDTDRLSRLIVNAQIWADTLIDQSPQKNQRACHAGCAWCCYLPVVLVTTAEALYLAGWLRSHCSTSELDALRYRLSARLQRQQTPAEKDAPPSPARCCAITAVWSMKPVPSNAAPGIRCGWPTVNRRMGTAGLHAKSQ